MTRHIPKHEQKSHTTAPPKHWAKSHPCGVREIDSTNECLEFLLERHFLGGIPCESAGDFCPKIEDVRRFLTRKFTREEALMERVEFPGLAPHRAEHVKLLAELDAMRNDLSCGTYDLQRVFRVLTTWAVRHVRQFDDPFGRHLTSQIEVRRDAENVSWRLEI
jgi:hemerythrin-like metal-binding protein